MGRLNGARHREEVLGRSSQAFFKHPQNSETLSRAEVSSLIDDIYKMFKDHPGCEEWTNKLLGELRDSTDFDAGSITDILEDFRQNGTITVIQSENRAGSAGPGRIDISSAVRNTGDTATVMGEIIHSTLVGLQLSDLVAGWPRKRHMENTLERQSRSALATCGYTNSVENGQGADVYKAP